MPIIIVRVVFLSKTVFEWEGLPVNEDMNIEEFFKDVVACELLKPELWEKNCVAYFSYTKTSETEKIGLKCNACETVKQCGKYVTFKLLNDINNEPAVKTINAFELMRTTSMLNYLPEFKLPAKNSWEQLRIDLNELIRTSGGGWIGKDNANNIGKKFVSDLTKSIWQRSRFIEKLKLAFPFKIGKYTYHHGNVQNSVYIWRIDNNIVELYIETQNIDDRVEMMFELGDPDLITDFREINEVLKICPPNIPIPSIQWIRLQFWPKNPTHKNSLQFTGKLPVKFMVQARQLRCDHEDLHYASALFRYQKEMAILLQVNSWLIFMDDKHRCKVGEPGYPVAAVERGRQVIVSKNNVFKVADHDFTKCALIALFLKLDLDLLIAVRTPPGHSWKNPVERIMSIL
ncbi:hypothetical protein C1645_882972, partial [Glomus cerebriforme]